MLIPPNVFKASGCACRDASRYQLGGIHYRRDGDGRPIAEATDGKTLIQTTWFEPDPSEFPAAEGFDAGAMPGFKAILPTAACIEASKMAFSRQPKPILEYVAMDEAHANGTVPLFATDLKTRRHIEPRTCEETYPNVDRCIPSGAPTVSFKVDAAYLLQLVKTIQGIHGTKGIRLDVSIYEPDRPIEFSAKSDGIETRGFVMPLVLDK